MSPLITETSKPDYDCRSDLDEIIHIQARPGGYENLGKLLKINPKRLTQNGKLTTLLRLKNSTPGFTH
jgi:hypothetical protein